MTRNIVDTRDAKRVLKEIRYEARLIDDEGPDGAKLFRHRADHVAQLLEWLEMRFPVQHKCHALAQQVVKHMRKFTDARGNMDDLKNAADKFEEVLDTDPSAVHIIRVVTVEQFQELAAKYGPWHEPDEQGVSGRVSSGGLGTAGNSVSEATLVVYLIGLPVFEVNVSLLIEWAAWPPKATAGDGK